MALVFIGWLVAAPATAEDRSEGELVRWVPALAFSFDMLNHKAQADISTSNVLGPPVPPHNPTGCSDRDQAGNPVQTGTVCLNSPLAVAPSTTGSDTDVAALVNASLELTTPRLVDAFFSPRLFGHADVAISFGLERTLSGERKPAEFFLDALPANVSQYSEGQVGGQGSRAIMQLRQVVAGAGGGIAFTATIFGRSIRLKPSFEYLYEEVDLIASVRRAVKLRGPALSFNDFRLVDLSADSKEPLHGIGGGLEVEMDAGRIGPVMMSIFASGRAYHFVGNLHHTFHDENEFGENATWNFDLDPWTYRGAVGARFRWLPE